MKHHPPVWLFGVVAILLLQGAMILPSEGSTGNPQAGGTAGGAILHPSDRHPGLEINLSLVLNESAYPLSPAFWGVDADAESSLGQVQATTLNATPVRVVVWPGGGVADRYDILNHSGWSNGTIFSVTNSSEAQFVSWCREVRCEAILQVPGEVDNASLAQAIVNYTVNSTGLNFTPAYWEVGNEPGRWNNWGLNWSKWNISNNFPITAVQYAWEVRNYTIAMDQAVPGYTPKIIGLPGVGKGANGETKWIDATVAVNGPNLSAVAIHVYPYGNNSSPNVTLPLFYHALYGPAALPTRIQNDSKAIASACHQCRSLPPLFVTEFNSAGQGTPSGYLNGFANIPYVAAIIAQAMGLNVSNLDYYSLQSVSYPAAWMNSANVTGPDYLLYSQIFSRLGNVVHPIQATGGELLDGLIAALTENQTTGTESLLVANANATDDVTLNLTGLALPAGVPAGLWTWNNSSASSGPTEESLPSGSPLSLGIPPESIALLVTPAYPVVFHETGLPPGTNWSVTFDSLEKNLTTDGANDSLSFPSEPNGTYLFSVGDVSGWHQNNIPYQGNLTVSGSARSEDLSYVQVTYKVTFSESGLPPLQTWTVMFNGKHRTLTTNGSADTLTFPQEPNGTYNYSIANVRGWYQGDIPYTGNESVHGSPLVVGVNYSQENYSVTFLESGLPSGTNWSVTFNGANRTAPANGSVVALAFVPEPNGSYPYSITGVPGYHEYTIPYHGTVNVSGEALIVNVTFVPFTSTVTFDENGLPAGTNWSVTLNGSIGWNRTGGPIVFEEPNGTYPYHVGAVPDWEVLTANGSVFVNGTNVTVLVEFNLTFMVTFTETGVSPGTAWSVTLNGRTDRGTSGALYFNETNGTFSFSVGAPAGYNATPPSGNVPVLGVNVTRLINFSRTTYSVRFTETGLPQSDTWHVNVSSGPMLQASGATTSLLTSVSNGTYNFTAATNDKTYTPVCNKTFNVTGTSVYVVISFQLVTYAVTFTERGLPSYDLWCVNISGEPPLSALGADPPLVAKLPNGSYTVTVATNDPRYIGSYNSTYHVDGAPLSEIVTFVPFDYTLTFTEAGLPSGTAWSVTIDTVTHTSSGATITFEETNGTYAVEYSTGDHEYAPSHYQASVPVAGATVLVIVPFSLVTFTVTIVESGLPPGTNWSITINGSTDWNSSGAPIMVVEPNGTFSFNIGSVSGYSAMPVSGSLTVQGEDATGSVLYSAVSPSQGGHYTSSGGGQTFLGLPATEGYVLLVGLVVAVLVTGIASFLFGRRPKAGTESQRGPPPPARPPDSG